MIHSGGVRFHPALQSLLVDIADLSPHPDNPSNGDMEAVAESIEISGMYRPVYAQRSTGFVLGGNTTYSACLYLGAELIPVVWLDVDGETAVRIMLGDNQIARLALVDQALLAPALDALLSTELKLLGTGYAERPVAMPSERPPGHTVTVTLTEEYLVAWFELPGSDDRARLLNLIDTCVTSP